MSGSFNIEGAKQAGYSDGEIASFLASQHGFDIDAARKAGYNDGEITGFLAAAPVAKPTEYAPTAAPGEAPAPMGTGKAAAPDDYAGTGAEGMAPDQQSPIASGIGRALSFVGKNFEDEANVREGIASRIGGAAAKAYQDTPSPVDPNVTNAYPITPVLRALGAAPAAFHAGGAAIAQSAMEVFGEKGGRDVLGWLAAIGGPEMMTAPAMGFSAAPESTVARAAQAPLEVARDLRADRAANIQPAAPAVSDFSAMTSPLPTRGTPNQGVGAVLAAPDLDSAISAAQDVAGVASGGRDFSALVTPPEAAQAPTRRLPGIYGGEPDVTTGPFEPAPATAAPPTRITSSQVQARDGVGAIEAARRAAAENAALEPQSVGAAASREQTPASQIDLSTADMKANRRQAELNELYEQAQPGDNTIYVEGSNPTLAERTGDPTTSQVENMLRERRAGFFSGEGKPLTEANKARVRAIDNEGIPDTTLKSMRDERTAEWGNLSKDIIPKSKSADLSDYEGWINGQLADPRIQENDAVVSVLQNLQNRLYGSDGQLKADPAAVWGMHDQLQNMLAKAKDPLQQTSAEAYANKEILIAKKFVDDALNEASGNQFQVALDAYAKRSQEIRAGELMNELRSKVVNMHGELQPQRFHNDVLALAKDRGNPGIDPSMDISDKTMRTLLNVDADLKRAGLIKMGAPRGSQTNLMGYLSDRLGRDAAVRILGAIPVVGRATKPMFDVLNEMHIDKLARQHTAPPEGGYTYHPSLLPETP